MQIFKFKCHFANANRLAGPLSAIYCYISEFHTMKTATRATAYATVFINGLVIYMALFAMVIMTMDWNFKIFGIDFKPWRFYMVMNSLINLWNAVVFFILPESPKFLLSQNRTEEAIEVLSRVYAFNTGLPKEVIWLLLQIRYEIALSFSELLTELSR